MCHLNVYRNVPTTHFQPSCLRHKSDLFVGIGDFLLKFFDIRQKARSEESSKIMKICRSHSANNYTLKAAEAGYRIVALDMAGKVDLKEARAFVLTGFGRGHTHTSTGTTVPSSCYPRCVFPPRSCSTPGTKATRGRRSSSSKPPRCESIPCVRQHTL